MPFSFTQQLDSYRGKLGALPWGFGFCVLTWPNRQNIWNIHEHTWTYWLWNACGYSFDTTILYYFWIPLVLCAMHKAESIHKLLYLHDRSNRFRTAVMTVGCWTERLDGRGLMNSWHEYLVVLQSYMIYISRLCSEDIGIKDHHSA